MTQDEIIKLARQAGGTPYVNRHYPGETSFAFGPKAFEAFAKLVAEKEREVHRSYIHELEHELEVAQDKINEYLVAEYQRTKVKKC